MSENARALVLAADLETLALFGEALLAAGVSRVVAARQVADALQHCQYGGFSFALVDRALSGEDGCAFVNAVRAADHPAVRMPVILIEPPHGADRSVRAVPAPPTVAMVKPLSAPAIAARIRAYFSEPDFPT